MPPSFQQQGQGYNSQDAGYFPMIGPGGSFQTLTTTDEDEDYAMSASSGIYGNYRTYQNRPQYLMDGQLQGAPHGELPISENEYPPQSNTNGGLLRSNVPVDYWMAAPDAWNTAGPSRQNSLEVNQQLLEQFPGNDFFTNPDDSQWTPEPATGYHDYVAAGHLDQPIPFDPAAAIFPEDPEAVDYHLEPNQGLRSQDGANPYYSPNIELPPPSTGDASQNMVVKIQDDPPSTQRPPYNCQWENCRRHFTSKTEFNKHMARHQKREVCPELGCGQGFAARIDLERHCDSVHQHDLDGNPTHKQACLYQGCSNSFPQTRKDNLKTHLIKIHHIEKELAEQMISSLATGSRNRHRHRHASLAVRGREYQANNSALLGGSAVDANTLDYQRQHTPAQSSEVSDGRNQGQFQTIHTSMVTGAYLGNSFRQDPGHLRIPIDPLLAPGGTAQNKTSLSMGNQNWAAYPMPSSQPTATRYSSQEMEDVQETLSFSTLPSPHGKQNRQQLCQQPSSQEDSRLRIIEGVLNGSSPGQARSFSHSSSLLNASVKPSLRSFASAPEGDYHSMDEDPYSPEMSVEEPQAKQILHALEERYDFVEKNSTMPSVASTPAANPVDPHPPNCKGCLKWKDKPYLWNKHIKRKAKKYFCPDEDCPDTFGSKNDQMRHHNSHHKNLEKFICGIVHQGVTCAKDFNHADGLKQHLTSHHSILANDAKGLVKKMRFVEKNYPDKFWCGICECWISLADGAEARREALFTHIEDHLEARNGERFGTAQDWSPQVPGGPQIPERTLHCARQSGSASKNSSESQHLAQKTPSGKGNARPQPAKAISSADHKRRQSSMSPSSRSQTAKKLKSDTDLGKKTKEKEKDVVAAKPRRGEATVATITYTCCRCSDFGAAATGLCQCGHQYNSECCQQTVVRQPSDEFGTRGRRRQDREREGDKDGSEVRGHTMYNGLGSRSVT